MSRLAIAALAAGAAAAFAAPAVAQEAFTTRIEPRPFYGAVVTMESGVRVFRPLPPTRQVIVNPGGQTPLNLGYYDTRVTEHSTSTNHHYNYNYDGDDDSSAGVGYWGGFRDRRFGRGHDGRGVKGRGTFTPGR